MTRSNLITKICDQFKNSSEAMQSRVGDYLNWIQQDISSRRNWEYLLATSFFQCTDDYTTGTAYASGTTVTGVGTTFTSGMVGRKIRIGGEDDYYDISAFTSITSITISQTYRGTYDTSGEATTYVIYDDIYSLAADAEKIVSLISPVSNQKLQYLSRQEFNTLVADPSATGVPQYWIPAGYDSSGYLQIQLYLIPDSNYTIYYWYRKQLADLTADSDESLIPTKYHILIYYGALAMAFEYDDNALAGTYRSLYENGIESMIADLESGAEDAIPTLQSIDDKSMTGYPSLRLPPAHFRN